MWGNSRGWIFSAIIVLVTAGGLWLLSTQNDVSPPTWDPATQQKYLGKVALATDPRTLVPVMTKPCDAGDTYRSAIAAYRENRKMYDNLKKTDFTAQVAFDDILEGTECSSMTLLSKDPMYVGYDNKFNAPLIALSGLTKAMTSRGLGLITENRMDDARKYFEATFSLGAKLWEERVVWEELDLGQGLMSTSVYGLSQIAKAAKENDRAAALLAFDASRMAYMRDVLMPVEKSTHHLDSPNPGDVFLLAEHSQDRMWRVEAIRQLGRIRFNVSETAATSSAADQRAATRRVTKWASDTSLDPVIRAAAEKARDVTKDELQAELTAGNEESGR